MNIEQPNRNCRDCSCLNCEVSNICTVCLIGKCIEGMAVLGQISGCSFKLHKTCQSGVETKNILLFCTVFRHVALLVTEISRQDRTFGSSLVKKNCQSAV